MRGEASRRARATYKRCPRQLKLLLHLGDGLLVLLDDRLNHDGKAGRSTIAAVRLGFLDLACQTGDLDHCLAIAVAKGSMLVLKVGKLAVEPVHCD